MINFIKSVMAFIGRHKVAFAFIVAFALWWYKPEMYSRGLAKVAEFFNITTEKTKDTRKDLDELKKSIK